MTGVSTLGQALRQIQNIKSQQMSFSDLSTQLASGKKTNSFAGLNTDVLPSLRSRTGVKSLDVYSNNIQKADTRISVILQSIGEYQAQTKNVADTLAGFVQQGSHQKGNDVIYDDPATPEVETTVVGKTSAEVDSDLQAVQDHATSLYPFLLDLLNTQEGDRYVFAGSDTFTKPINDSGTLDAAMSTLITKWKDGTISNKELIADLTDRTALDGNPDALTDTVIGYSPQLSSGNTGDVYVRASEDSEFKYTTLANEDPLRNIVVALAFLKNQNLPPIEDVYKNGTYPGVPDVQGAPGQTAEEMQNNFYEVFNAVDKMVVDSADSINKIRYRMENVRVQMDQTKKSQENQKNLLLSTISDIEDVNTNEVAVKINTLQTQLQASYSVTSMASKLSLVNFL